MNLPYDYAKIFQFANFKRTFTKVLKDHIGITSGSFVTVHVKNISMDQFGTFFVISFLIFKAQHQNGRPLIASGLFKYENKVSVLNLAIHRTPNHTGTSPAI